jgi:dihydrofolate reductase
MLISCIAAMAHNNVIGLQNKMPWHLPADLKHFKSITLSKPIIMGRKTFESIGKPLPGRRNIVVTRNPEWGVDDVDTVTSLDAAIKLAAETTPEHHEIMIIGGGQIYAEAMPLANRLYITEIDIAPEGDAFFPSIDKAIWTEKERTYHESTGKYPAYSFVIYDRV